MGRRDSPNRDGRKRHRSRSKDRYNERPRSRDGRERSRKYESESSMKSVEKVDSKSNSHSSRDVANKRPSSPPHHSRKRSRKSRSRSRSPGKTDGRMKSKKEPILVDLESSLNDEAEMMKQMGFGSFDSTKGKHVSGNYFVTSIFCRYLFLKMSSFPFT